MVQSPGPDMFRDVIENGEKDKDLLHAIPILTYTDIWVLNGAVKLIVSKDAVEYTHHLVLQISIGRHVFFWLMKPQRSSFKAN